MIARFIRFYGADTWHNPRLWPTTDGIVMMLGMTSNIMMLEQMQQGFATAQGIGIAFTDKKDKQRLKQKLQKMEEVAYPRKTTNA